MLDDVREYVSSVISTSWSKVWPDNGAAAGTADTRASLSQRTCDPSAATTQRSDTASVTPNASSGLGTDTSSSTRGGRGRGLEFASATYSKGQPGPGEGQVQTDDASVAEAGDNDITSLPESVETQAQRVMDMFLASVKKGATERNKDLSCVNSDKLAVTMVRAVAAEHETVLSRSSTVERSAAEDQEYDVFTYVNVVMAMAKSKLKAEVEAEKKETHDEFKAEFDAEKKQTPENDGTEEMPTSASGSATVQRAVVPSSVFVPNVFASLLNRTSDPKIEISQYARNLARSTARMTEAARAAYISAYSQILLRSSLYMLRTEGANRRLEWIASLRRQRNVPSIKRIGYRQLQNQGAENCTLRLMKRAKKEPTDKGANTPTPIKDDVSKAVEKSFNGRYTNVTVNGIQDVPSYVQHIIVSAAKIVENERTNFASQYVSGIMERAVLQVKMEQKAISIVGQKIQTAAASVDVMAKDVGNVRKTTNNSGSAEDNVEEERRIFVSSYVSNVVKTALNRVMIEDAMKTVSDVTISTSNSTISLDDEDINGASSNPDASNAQPATYVDQNKMRNTGEGDAFDTLNNNDTRKPIFKISVSRPSPPSPIFVDEEHILPFSSSPVFVDESHTTGRRSVDIISLPGVDDFEEEELHFEYSPSPPHSPAFYEKYRDVDQEAEDNAFPELPLRRPDLYRVIYYSQDCDSPHDHNRLFSPKLSPLTMDSTFILICRNIESDNVRAAAPNRRSRIPIFNGGRGRQTSSPFNAAQTPAPGRSCIPVYTRRANVTRSPSENAVGQSTSNESSCPSPTAMPSPSGKVSAAKAGYKSKIPISSRSKERQNSSSSSANLAAGQNKPTTKSSTENETTGEINIRIDSVRTPTREPSDETGTRPNSVSPSTREPVNCNEVKAKSRIPILAKGKDGIKNQKSKTDTTPSPEVHSTEPSVKEDVTTEKEQLDVPSDTERDTDGKRLTPEGGNRPEPPIEEASPTAPTALPENSIMPSGKPDVSMKPSMRGKSLLSGVVKLPSKFVPLKAGASTKSALSNVPKVEPSSSSSMAAAERGEPSSKQKGKLKIYNLFSCFILSLVNMNSNKCTIYKFSCFIIQN